MQIQCLLERATMTLLKTSLNTSCKKIVKIGDDLSNAELYDLVWCDVPFPLLNFGVLLATKINCSVSKLQTKSCKLDLVPTKILNENLDYFITAITHVVNLSMQNGQFDDDWKCSVLKPLMKKLNSPRVNNNYRPVSKLPFIFKLVKNVCRINLLTTMILHV